VWSNQCSEWSGFSKELRVRVAVRRRSSSLSSVQVLRMAPGSEGAHTEHSVMGLDDGDGSEYIPR
jgi:hypothetical protein